MPPHRVLASIITVGSLAWDYRVNRRNRRNQAAVIEYINLLEEAVAFQDSQVKYLLSLVNRSDLEMDEFDKIAMSHLDFVKK